MADISHISIPSFNIDGDINDTIARTTINNHVADKNNPHNVTKAQIGLGNVDNTSDMDKPISTAVQNALDKKADNTLATESSPGLMSAEDKKAVDREFFKLVPRGATYVPHGADLRDNQYFKVGTYYHDGNSSEKPKEREKIYGMPGPMLHESPLAGFPFIMYVMAPYSDKYDDESTADEMTLERLRIMIVEGSIYTQGAFNRYKVVEPGEGELNEMDWFTDYWTKIADEADIKDIKHYMDEHIYSKSNPHGVTKDQVGLGNVDNTADKDKSVMYANQAYKAGSADYAKSAGTAYSVAWGNVSGKPSTYPPSSHTHTKDQVGLDNVDNTADKDKSVKYAESAGSANSVAWDNVTGKPTTMASSVAWNDVTDKPSTYPPSSHTHTKDEVGLGNVDNTADKDKSVKYAESAGTASSITWKNVSDKPSTYPPNAHTHTPAEVGLGNVDNTADKDKPISTAVQKALDGKANNSVATSSTDGLMSKSDKAKLDSIEAGSNVESVNGKTGAVNLSKADIGLSNVDNTADKDKSVKHADTAGSATNDRTGNDIVDTYATNETVNAHISNTNNPHKVTKAQVGLGNVDNTADKDKSVKYAESAGSANSVAWDDISGKPSTFASSVTWDNVTDKPSTYTPAAHTHTPAEVGLGNVDNTADIDKPISTPVQNALNNKVTKSNTADTNGLLNSLTAEETTPTDADYYISQHAGGGTTTTTTTYHRRPMSALWAFIKSKCDSIYATVSALNAHISNKSNPHGVTKAQVGLSNVDNTADSAKSVKYAASAGSANAVAWGNVSDKPSTYPPSSHTHDLASSSSNGLMSAADKSKLDGIGAGSNVKSVNGKTGAVNLSKADVGLGNVDNTADSAKSVNYAANADTVDGLHEYSFLRYRDSTSTNGAETLWDQIGIREYWTALPSGLSGLYNFGAVVSLPCSFSRFDLYYNHHSSYNGDGLYYRTGWGVDKKGWVHLIDSQSIGSQSVNYATSAGSANAVAWDNVSGKPSTYPPAGHTHTKDQVGLGNVDNTADSAKSVKYAASAGNANSVAWGNVSGKPSTYPPASHTHSYLPLSGGTVTGKLNAAGRLTSPTNGGTWVDGKDVNNAVLGISTQADVPNYRWDPIIAQKDYAGGTWNIGSIGNQVGVAGFYKDRTVNGVDWYHYIDTTNGTVHFGAQVYANVTGALSGNATSANYANSAGHADSADYANSAWATLDSVYPVGSIYMSTSSTSPAQIFGGTWLPIVNQFLFGSGGVYAAGETGGEYNHTLTMDEVIQYGMWISDPVTKYNSQIDLNFNAGYTYGIRTYNKSAVAHNNMPPYLVVYMWRRTA